MFRIRHARRGPKRLPDDLPWCAIVAPGVVLQKDGLLQTTLQYIGADRASTGDAERVAIKSHINNALMRLGSGWATFTESARRKVSDYEQSEWEHYAAWISDVERAHLFRTGTHYESKYFLTYVWKMPGDAAGMAERFFYEDHGGTKAGGDPQKAVTGLDQNVEKFVETVQAQIDLLSSGLPFVARLNDGAMLTYLKSTISTVEQAVKTPDVPDCLDAFLPDEAFTAGDYPMLGDNFVLSCTVTGFPKVLFSGVMDCLNFLQEEYRWVTRYIALDREDAEKLIEQFRTGWMQKRWGLVTKGLTGLTKGEQSDPSKEAVINAEDANAALQCIAEQEASFGYFTTTVTVWDQDLAVAKEKLRAVAKALRRQRFVVKLETLHNAEAWFGSHPGNVYANVRRPVLSTLNVCDMIPASAIWQGNRTNYFLKEITASTNCEGVGSAHLRCTTDGATPFFLNLNVDDVGHTLVLGPTGGGKSVLLATLAINWFKYPNAQVIFFDINRSSRAATIAMGGVFYEPANGDKANSWQPLRNLDDENQITWASMFVHTLFAAQGVAITPDLKSHVNDGLKGLAFYAKKDRTISKLSDHLSTIEPEYGRVLEPYCHGGVFSQIFDANEEQEGSCKWTVFEMNKLLGMSEQVVRPALFYLFHRLERQLTGAPTIIVVDELARYLRVPEFRDWFIAALKTLRKENVFLVFATQEVADIAEDARVASAVDSNCPTTICLPNPKALKPEVFAAYRDKLGLSHEVIAGIAKLEPKKDYYYVSPEGCRPFSLSLGEAQLAFVGMSSPKDHEFLDSLVANRPPEEHVEAMLEYRGVDWAARMVRERRLQDSYAPISQESLKGAA